MMRPETAPSRRGEAPTEVPRRTVLVTGASGYIGGRLVPDLLERGWRVRCVVRSARKLELRPWARHANLEVIEGDAADDSTMSRAMEGCYAGYYLIHSMGSVSRWGSRCISALRASES